jgi:hypothetical protein
MLQRLQLDVHRCLTEPAGEMKQKEIAFRKMVITVPAVLAGTGTFIAFAAIAFTHGNGSDFFGAVIISGFIYFFWLAGWHSAVRLGPAGVQVDNIAVRTFIPWEELSDIAVGSGLEFRLRDGGRVQSLMYGGGSLVGVTLGYRYTRKVAEKIRAVSAEMIAAAPRSPGRLLIARASTCPRGRRW